MTVEHGFELIEDRQIPELNTRARYYRHLKTGARLLSLSNDDDNKVFGISFRTPAPDSTGLPHIMEHSVLCGSRKYPVKEPFVELLKGSLNTFVNAFTFPDKTCYPVASQNLQDFYNLIDVYLDAVLYPLISPYTLKQEGWHYELDELEGEMTYKGVVFNEMKGAYSSPDSLLGEQSQQQLYPDITYGLDSGGDPVKIPDLTYDQFLQFHQTYYHPSNAYIFFYGNDDPGNRLRILNEWLQSFEPIQVNSSVGLQKAFKSPRQVTIPYDAGSDQENAKAFLAVNWLLPEVGDPTLMLSLGLLAHILIGTPAAPLRKALIDSGLGEDLTGGGLENQLRQMNFSTGLKGIALEDAPKVEALIDETLQQLAQGGIEPETIAASLNTIEFRLRENNTGSFPRGISLMLRSLSTWLHEGDPIEPLAFETPLAEIRALLKQDPRYFEKLLQAHLIDNSHRVTVILKPDPELGKSKEASEAERLANVRQQMTQAELQAVISDTRELKRRQEAPDTPEALAAIPTLKLSDLDPEIKRIPSELLDDASSRILYHDLFTNGIFYLDVGLNLHTLPQEWLPMIPLFGRALVQMGTAREDFVRLSQRIGRTTGGIHPDWFSASVHQSRQAAAWMMLRGKSTVAQASDLMDILQDILLTVRLDDHERFRQITLESKAEMEAMLAPAGHRLVNRRLRSRLGEADWATEQMGGISYLYSLRELARQVDEDWPAVHQILESIRETLVNRQTMLLNITLDEANWETVQPVVSALLEKLPASGSNPVAWNPSLPVGNEGLTFPSQINFVGKGLNLYQAGYEFDGSEHVISPYLRNTYLWDKVRVQGGAYGAFATFDRFSGGYTQLSYRDPNLHATIEVFDQASQFLRGIELSQSELTKAIISAIGDMDAYQLPDAQGYTALSRYLVGSTDEMRQGIRNQILETNAADFHAFGEALASFSEQGQVVVLGSQDAIQAANQDRPNWLEVRRVL
jgi:presequence protease